MGKASLLTPVYFFSSIRAGSGKSSMLANLAVYLNNINQKIAIVDLDAETPRKLKNAFPRSINLQEYSDISLISQGQDSRYQKNFYFTETSLISYFPAHQLKDVPMLFSDTTLRDFFIQITACFDTVIVNFPSGPLHCQKASELLARQHLWRGKSPVSIVVSQSDEKSLVSLDSLIHENPAFYYQLQENALLLFNRVPTSVEDQKLSENTLNSLELRSLFNFPATYVVGISEEFPYQRQIATPLVLNQDSMTHQTISSLHRLLTSTARNLSRSLYEHTSDYQACLDGQLLEKLSPYLEKIQASAARKLLQHPSDVQVFLEESEGNYRVRIRLSGVRQPLSGIPRTIEISAKRQIRDRQSPAIWPYRKQFNIPAHVDVSEKKERPTLSAKPVYRFDDRFAESVDFRLLCDFDFHPRRGRYPSPIFIKPELEMPEIPSLSEVLGYSRKQFKKCSFAICPQLYAMPGVSHFFIPPEFDLASTFRCAFEAIFITELRLASRWTLRHSNAFVPAYELSHRKPVMQGNLPDEFARNRRLEPEHDFLPIAETQAIHEFTKASAKRVRIRHSEPMLARSDYLVRRAERAEISRHKILAAIGIYASVKISPPAFPPLRTVSKLRRWFDSFYQSSITDQLPEYKDWQCNLEMLMSTQDPAAAELFRFSFGGESEAYKTDIFAKTVICSPTEFFVSEAVPAKEIYLPAPELVVPTAFKFADVLIDHFFAPTVFKFKQAISLAVIPAGRLYTPAHNTFFKEPLKPCIGDAITKALKVARQNLEHRFTTAGSDYQSLPYRNRKEQPALHHQILQAALSFPQMSFYRDISDRGAVRTDIILDAKPNWRNMPPQKGKITDLRVLLSRPPSLNMSLARKPAKPVVELALTKCVLRQLCDRKLPDKFSAAVAPHLSQILKGAAADVNLPTSSYYRCSTQCELPANPAFCIQEPELYTIPVRTGSRQIHNYVSTSINSQIEIKAVIEKTNFEHQTVYSEKFAAPMFNCKSLNHSAFPLRSRKIELPRALEFGNASSVKKILDHESKVTREIDNSFTGRFGMLRAAARPAYLPIVLSKQTLPKSASKIWKRLALPSRQFRAIFPNKIETLYRHLLWSIAAKRQQPAVFSKSFLLKSDGKTMRFGAKNPASTEQVVFCDKNYTPVNRLSLQVLRGSIKLSKLSRKDIMNLARQTIEKFNQVSNQLRA